MPRLLTKTLYSWPLRYQQNQTSMERELELPDVGEGIAEGEIVQWLVESGDQVTEDQPLAEVETDKAVVEVPSPEDGTVTQLHADEGEIVAVGSVIVTFDVGDGDGTAAEATEAEDVETGTHAADTEPASSTEPAPAAGTDESGSTGSVPASQVVAPPRVKRLARELGVAIGAIEGADEGARITEADVHRAAGQAPTSTGNGETPATRESDESAPESAHGSAGGTDAGAGTNSRQQVAQAATTATGGGAAAVEADDREKTLAAPATRQLARELDVDIDGVPASEERDGHAFVTPEDVRSFAEGGVATPEAGGAEASAGAGTSAGGNGTAQPTTAPSATTGAAEPGQREERVPYRGVRRTIGQQMEESKYSAPHVSHHDSVDVTELVETRQELKTEVDDDVSLTYLPFVMKAVVAGLEEYPEINATLDEEAGEIVRKRYYNVGVATATEAGLMVPVVKNVDEKGTVQLARETAGLVERARSRDISPAEMQGGTFSITNFGAIGGEYATPIINYPEAAILGLGAIEERPVVEDGEVVARTTLPLSLTVDHRLIDGAEAAAFVNDVKRYLNNPSLLML